MDLINKKARKSDEKNDENAIVYCGLLDVHV